MAGGFRKCTMEGGPFTGWDGDYFDKGQTTAEFGEGAEANCYVYRLDERRSTRDRAVWRYDKTESDRRIMAAGLADPQSTRGVIA